MIITDHQPLNQKHLIKDTGKDSGTTTEEGDHIPLTLNSREEILMRWTPQQAKPQLKSRRLSSARKTAAMNARGPFQYVSMDLITDLPRSEGYDAILMIVN